jgi:hypothetical protein
MKCEPERRDLHIAENDEEFTARISARLDLKVHSKVLLLHYVVERYAFEILELISIYFMKLPICFRFHCESAQVARITMLKGVE